MELTKKLKSKLQAQLEKNISIEKTPHNPSVAMTHMDKIPAQNQEGAQCNEVRFFIEIYDETLWGEILDGRFGQVFASLENEDEEDNESKLQKLKSRNLKSAKAEKEKTMQDRYLIMSPLELMVTNTGLKIFTDFEIDDKIAENPGDIFNVYLCHHSLQPKFYSSSNYKPLTTKR